MDLLSRANPAVSSSIYTGLREHLRHVEPMEHAVKVEITKKVANSSPALSDFLMPEIDS
jgi:hypothetical protein